MIRWAVILACLFAVSLAGSAEQPGLRTQVGLRITLDGVAETRKLGAVLRGENFELWIDRLEQWPVEVLKRKVRVTGILDERYDLPVYIPKASEPPAAGIPVPEGTDLRLASHRYIVRDARWSLIP